MPFTPSDLLVGTFNLGTMPEPYYLDDMSDYWQNLPRPPCISAVLRCCPRTSSRESESWCMAQADRIVQERGYHYLRFDGVAHHERLMRFYSRLGYRPCGLLPVYEDISVMCFEKALQPA